MTEIPKNLVLITALFCAIIGLLILASYLQFIHV